MTTIPHHPTYYRLLRLLQEAHGPDAVKPWLKGGEDWFEVTVGQLKPVPGQPNTWAFRNVVTRIPATLDSVAFFLFQEESA